jgi:outer membrane protein assembly factor BamB
MKALRRPLALLALVCTLLLGARDWPQGSGSGGNFETSESGPVEWSAALDQNISWKLTLPETGQSTPVIPNGKVFFSTLKPLQGNAEISKDIIAWCCDAFTGKLLWKKDIPGKHPLRLSGCFRNSSSPPAVTDGEHVIFINASSGITCFTVSGDPVWNQDFLSVGRCLPFLHHGKYIFTREIYPPEKDGNFPHKYANSPKELWTQLQALDMKTGKILWTTECGINMGVSVIPQKLSNGREVVVAGRGGGHGPPEKTEGISLVDLTNGATLWTLPLEKFSATMSFGIRNDRVHFFHGPNHLLVDALTGKIVREVTIIQDVPVRHWNKGERKAETMTLTSAGSRKLTQTSNLLVGKWHYIRHYKQPWLGRVNVAAPSPTVAGSRLYLPVMNGTIYIINWKADALDEKSIIAINDLGPIGQSYNRASLSFANGKACAHTIKELICIGK